MANGKKRRRVAWLSSSAETHAFLPNQSHCVCNAFSKTEAVSLDPRLPRCRPCEIGVQQLW